MNFCKRIKLLSGILFFLVLLPHFVSAAKDSAMNHYIDGTEAYETGDYEAAIKSIGKAMELDTTNLDFQYYFGMSYSALGRYQEAISILNAILKKDAKHYYKAYFDLAGIYSKTKQYKKALETISDAEWIVPDSSRLYLEKGSIYRKMKNYKSALDNFKRAFELNPKLRQTVDYNIALVHYAKKDYAKAKQMFSKVIKQDPSNKLAEYSKKGIEGINDTIKAEKPWKAYVYLSYSYNDNISEDPLDLPGHMSSIAQDEDGQYQVFFFKGEYRFLERKKLKLSTGYQFSYLNYNDSEHENSLGNNPFLLMRYNLKPCYLSLKYEFGHYFADSDERFVQNMIKPSIIIIEPHNMKTVLDFAYKIKDYKFEATTEDVDIFSAELQQHFKIPGKKIFPRLGLKYGDEDSESDNETYSYFESSIGVSAVLPLKLVGDLAFTDIRTNYDKYNGVKREDTGYLIETSVMKNINKTVSTKLYYSYTHNSSNTTYSGTVPSTYSYDPFEYDKNLVRLSFSMKF